MRSVTTLVAVSFLLCTSIAVAISPAKTPPSRIVATRWGEFEERFPMADSVGMLLALTMQEPLQEPLQQRDGQPSQ